MSTVKIKVLKPISRKGLPPLAVGRELEMLKDKADDWVASGHAELVNADRKPIDIPKILAKKAEKKDEEII